MELSLNFWKPSKLSQILAIFFPLVAVAVRISIALYALNAAFEIANNYEDLVLISDIVDEGTNRFMYFPSLDSNNLFIIGPLLHRLRKSRSWSTFKQCIFSRKI